MSSTQNERPSAAVNLSAPSPEILESAALCWINRRCREAYLHEVRGGLHALYSALELLSRSAQLRQVDTTMAERASAIARRAMSNYEPLVLGVVESLTLGNNGGVATELDLGALTQEAVRFLRADIANKRLEVRLSIAADIRVLACKETARLWILGLLLTSVDAARTDGPLAISLARQDGQAVLAIAYAAPEPAGSSPEPARAVDGGGAEALILAMAARWAVAQGGRLDVPSERVAGDAIRVYYPLIATAEPEG